MVRGTKRWKWPVSSTFIVSVWPATVDFKLRAAAALAGRLQQFDLEDSRVRRRELPFGPVVLVDPEAERVLVRLRFVAELLAVDLGVLAARRTAPAPGGDSSFAALRSSCRASRFESLRRGECGFSPRARRDIDVVVERLARRR